MAPVFSHGDLRLYLLNLLDESPRHGYDLMQALSDRTGGTYTPSAGTIYPRLAKLEEEGLVTKVVDGRKTVYEITEAGRAEVAARAGELEGIEAGLADSVRLIAEEVRGSVREAMKSLRADLAASAQAERNSTKEHAAAGSTAGSGSAGSGSAGSASDDFRVLAREQLRRAESIVGEFRANVRADLRSHVAHGGELAASVVDDLSHALDDASRALTHALRR
ncbi:PadR family transcriptional regulator [Microbacterium sp.]|uniref:PadR family transcriptional regulator n=1 Tax=Microbacterium sp. TaxID=51671 RepID=UPI003C75E09B